MDTKITRLRNLLTPMKNFIAMVNADKRGESISTLLLDRELENINKYSDEIWAIIAEIPNDACEANKANTSTEPSIDYDGLSGTVICPNCKTKHNNGTPYCSTCIDNYYKSMGL